MKIIIVEGKAWELLRSSFADFILRVEQLIGNPPRNGSVARQRSCLP